jgi:glucose/arabinose dehydrogenase
MLKSAPISAALAALLASGCLVPVTAREAIYATGLRNCAGLTIQLGR